MEESTGAFGAPVADAPRWCCAAVIVALAPIAGWIASTSARGDRAPENLNVAGQPVGGDTRADVTTVVGSLASRIRRCPRHDHCW